MNMTIDQKRRAMQHVLSKRNRFSNCPRLQIPDESYRRRPSHRIADSATIQVSLRLLETASGLICRSVAVIAGIMLGLTFAFLICGVLLRFCVFVLGSNPSQGIQALILEQSWRNYVGWMLLGVSVFLCPYLLLGLPTRFGLISFDTADGFFSKRKILKELQRENENNDPTLWKPQAIGHCRTRHGNRSSGLIESPLFKVAAILGTYTAGFAGGSLLLIYLKCAIFLLLKDVGTFIFLSFFTGGLTLILGYWILIWFFRSITCGGLAVIQFLEQLLDNEPYRSALGGAIGGFFEKLFAPLE